MHTLIRTYSTHINYHYFINYIALQFKFTFLNIAFTLLLNLHSHHITSCYNHVTAHYIILHCNHITLHHITSHYIILHRNTLHIIAITLHRITSHYITSHYIHTLLHE